ncbi:LysR family transcriptional regulator [Microbacterium terrisoli]|uniref:LysR family transcriptional regulator n=1 Tax=Microbacterium terrisoli TaxID=3242192 RepID=UPI0028054E8D|nr:LysR family transcriptional regulator [Microbacterium protaetiae]
MHRHVPDLAALELMDAVARTGSMTAAAHELHVTQQAVSNRIRSAERLMGVELFVRSPQGARLTADGESVIAWARDVLAAAGRMGAALDLLRGSATRTLTVGGSQTIAAHLLPGWMLQLRERQLAAGQDATTVRLRTGNSAEIGRLVRSGGLDLGFIESPTVPADLGSTTVARDRLVVAVPPGHLWATGDGPGPGSGAGAGLDAGSGAGARLDAVPGAGAGSGVVSGAVPLATLAATPLVVRERGSGTRSAYELAVRERLGTEPAEPALELATAVAVLSAVAGGVAPAVLSELAIADDVELGRVRQVAIEGAAVTRPLTAVWRGGSGDLRGAARLLVEIAAS